MTHGKHILYLSSWYPNEYRPHLGNFVKRHAELISMDHNVHVLHTVASDRETKLRVTHHGSENFKETMVYHPRGKSIFSKRIWQKKALKKGLEKIEQADLLITQILLPKALQFLDVKRHFHCPWIHIEQGSYFRPEIWKDWPSLQKLVAKRAVRHMDQFFAVSDFLRKDLLPIFREITIDIIANPVNVEAFHPMEKNPDASTRFLHISTLDEKTKNPQGIFDACRILKKRRGSNFHLLIICDESTTKWKTYCEQHDLLDVVKFEGFKPVKELPFFYQKSHAFILNSIYETFSIVLAEAWATGTPTITTPVGIGAHLPHFLGFQSTIHDPESVAQCMENVMDGKTAFNPDKIRQRAMIYSHSNIRAQMNKIIEKHAG